MSILFCFGVIGVVTLSFGLYIRAGGFKTWYLVRGTPVVMPQALRSMPIPLGITFIVWTIVWSVSDIKIGNRLFGCIVIPMFVASMVLGIWNPRWLRPRWLVYLENEYGLLMWSLLKEAAKSPREWERRVRTVNELKEWAEETREKLGYPPRPPHSDWGSKQSAKGHSRKYRRTPEALQYLLEKKDKLKDQE